MHWWIQAQALGSAPTPSVQFLSFSCIFRQKSCQIIGFCPKRRGCPPRLGSPGSATEIQESNVFDACTIDVSELYIIFTIM